MKSTSYFRFFHCFIPSLPLLSNISPRYQKPVGEKHPKELHGHHLISCSLSDHALTEGSPKIRMGGAGTTLHSVPCLSSGVRTNNTVTSKPLHPTRLTHYNWWRNLQYIGFWGAPCPKLSLSLAMFAHHRRSLLAKAGSWRLTGLLGILRARLTHA